jgi:uncharacterized protein YndB with AHSA1/START domain
MSNAASSQFVYVTYIRTTPERLWSALTTPEFMRHYWFDAYFDTDWKQGSPWKLVFSDGRLADSGKIVEIDPPKRLALEWRNEWSPEIKDEGYGRCTMDLEPVDGAVKLTVTHSMERPESKLVRAVSGGWPKILSNLKSLLETGEAAIAAV